MFGGEFIEVLPLQPRSVIEPGVFVSFSAERMSAPFEDSESFSQGFYLDSARARSSRSAGRSEPSV